MKIDFDMPIDEVFGIKWRTGVAVAGRIACGEVRVGDKLFIRTATDLLPCEVTDFLVFGSLRVALAGDSVGILLSGVSIELVKPGQRLVSK